MLVLDDVNGRWVLDYLNDLDGEDAHPWLQGPGTRMVSD